MSAPNTVVRIDKVIDVANSEDQRVLTYIRSQITPEGAAARPEEDAGTGHLVEVADRILRNYEPKES